MNAPSSTPSAPSSTALRYRLGRPRGHYNRSHQPLRPANSSSAISPLDPAETLPARSLLCAIIEQAWIDLKPAPPLEDDFKEFERQLDRASALRFFRSTEFAILCDALRLSPEAIRDAAAHLTPTPEQQ